MCGRYVFFNEAEVMDIQQILSDLNQRLYGELIKTGEVFPTNKAAVLINNGGYKQAEAMKWGFPKWDGKGIIINARSETAAEKKMFAKPLENTRCVIPTTGFYEWDKNKTKYLFTYDDPVLYLAGIYNTFGKGKEQHNAFSIFTRSANMSIQDIHSRMPVILYKKEIEDYLSSADFAKLIFNRDDIKLNRSIA